MSNLTNIIKNAIKETGPLTIKKYMETCLYHKQYGYYMTKNPIGEDGDFITAPEISAVFGELIGVWLVNTWRAMGEPSQFNLVELGPGKGTLLKDIWIATANWPKFQKAADIYLFERSSILRKTQSHNLKNINLNWVKDLEELPDKKIICFSNEFFDALPIRQFIFKNKSIFEKRVCLNNQNEFQFEFFKVEESFNAKPEKKKLIESAVIECSETQVAILKSLCERVRKMQGCILIIDYGGEYGTVDTLQGMYKNKYCDVLSKPGEVDLTSQVDFGIIAEHAKSFGVHPSTLINQSDFLRKMGILERYAKLKQNLGSKVSANHYEILNRLLSHDQMGSLFKVLAIKSFDLIDIYPFSFK